VSVIARRILSTNSKGENPVSWLDWLNRPETLESHSLEYRCSEAGSSSPESLDISTNQVIVCSRVNELDAFGCSISTGKCVVVYNLLSCTEIARNIYLMEGRLAQIRFSLAGTQVAFSDGLHLRFLDSSSLASLTDLPLWAHSKFRGAVGLPKAQTIGILNLQWFDGDCKLATSTGIYDENMFSEKDHAALPFQCEVLIWDTINFTRLKTLYSFDAAIPIASSPHAIFFRPCVDRGSQSFWVDLENEKVVLEKGTFYPKEAIQILENYVDSDMDLLDLSLFWPAVTRDYTSAGAIFECICNSMTCALSVYSSHALIWDPVSGMFLVEFGGETVRVLGQLPIAQIALETQMIIPMIGNLGIDEGIARWGIAISPLGTQFAMLIDKGQIGIWSLPAEVKKQKNILPMMLRTQTIQGDGEFAFSPDGNFIVSTSEGAGTRLWKVDKTGVLEDWRPKMLAFDVQFMAAHDEDEGKRKELILLDNSSKLYITDLELKKIIWKEDAFNGKGRTGESATLIASHPLVPLVAVASTKGRIFLWIYNHLESNSAYIQHFTEIAPGTRVSSIEFAPCALDTLGFIEMTVSHQTGEITVWKVDLDTAPVLLDTFAKRYKERDVNTCLGYSKSGKYLVCLMSDGMLYFRERGDDRILEIQVGLGLNAGDVFVNKEGICSLTCSLVNEDIVAIASDMGSCITVISVSSPDWKYKEIKVDFPIISLCWTSDEYGLLSVAQDYTVSLWNTDLGQCMCEYVFDCIPLSETSLISSIRFALAQQLLVIKSIPGSTGAGNVFTLKFTNLSQFRSGGGESLSSLAISSSVESLPSLGDDWKSMLPFIWTIKNSFIEHAALRRDIGMIKVIVKKAASQSVNIQLALAHVLHACLQYHDVSQYDESVAIFAEPWNPGLEMILELGASLKSEQARRVYLFAIGIKSVIPISILKRSRISIESDASNIHALFFDCLDKFYDELPVRRESFIKRIVESTGRAGVNAVIYNQDALLCKACILGYPDVVKLCIDYCADARVNGDTPMLNAMATDNRDVIDRLKSEGATMNVKSENVFQWMKSHLMSNNFQFSALSKVKVRALYVNLLSS
jgi:WD40 repeat protein